MYSSLDIAKYFISKAKNSESNKCITQLQIQKILYFAQGYHLAHYNKPLIREVIEAWKYGPVFPNLYYKLRQYSSSNLCYTELSESNIASTVDDKEKDLLDWVWNIFKDWTASDLVTLTHTHSSWTKAFFNNQTVISEFDIKNEFIEKYKK